MASQNLKTWLKAIAMLFVLSLISSVFFTILIVKLSQLFDPGSKYDFWWYVLASAIALVSGSYTGKVTGRYFFQK